MNSRSGPAKSQTTVSPPSTSAKLQTSLWNCCAHGCAWEEILPLPSTTGWGSKEKLPNIHANQIECNEGDLAMDWYHRTRRINSSSLHGKSRRKAKTAEEGCALYSIFPSSCSTLRHACLCIILRPHRKTHASSFLYADWSKTQVSNPANTGV